MKKIINIWKENKLVVILLSLVLICLVSVAIISSVFFYGGSSSVYGDRLEGLKEISDSTLLTLKSKLKEEDTVDEVTFEVKGRVVYISILFDDSTAMDSAKKIAEGSVEEFSEDELNNYDIIFTITSNGEETNKFTPYTLMGSKNSSGSSTVVWSNFTKTSSEEE